MSMHIIAKFPGRCYKCGNPIHPGDKISWNRRQRGQAAHVACYDSDTLETIDVAHPAAPTPVEPSAPTPTHVEAPAAPSVLAEMIAQAVAPLVQPSLDETRVREIVNEESRATISNAIAALTPAPQRIIVERHENDTVVEYDANVQHKQFPLLLATLQARDARGNRLNVWLAGPAGTSKTTSAENAAAALGLDVATTGSLIESYRIFGFFAPGTGQYIGTPFRKIWETGGCFIFDDFDGSDPAVAVEMNNALANGLCTFPDGPVKRHPDCVIILTANTWGQGGTHEYVGRVRQDAAFLDRFIQIEWCLDESLETAITGNVEWSKRVQAVRAAVARKGIKIIITPRASVFGAALLRTGMSQEQVEAVVLRKGLTDAQWAEVSA